MANNLYTGGRRVFIRRPGNTGDGIQGLLEQLVEEAHPTYQVSEDRAEALDYYNQEPIGNDSERAESSMVGRSPLIWSGRWS